MLHTVLSKMELWSHFWIAYLNYMNCTLNKSCLKTVMQSNYFLCHCKFAIPATYIIFYWKHIIIVYINNAWQFCNIWSSVTSLSKATVNSTHSIYNKGHAVVDFNNIYRFCRNPSVFTKFREWIHWWIEVITTF